MVFAVIKVRHFGDFQFLFAPLWLVIILSKQELFLQIEKELVEVDASGRKRFQKVNLSTWQIKHSIYEASIPNLMHSLKVAKSLGWYSQQTVSRTKWLYIFLNLVRNLIVRLPLTSCFSKGATGFHRRTNNSKKSFELNMFLRKPFLYMVKPGRLNNSHSWSICQVPGL